MSKAFSSVGKVAAAVGEATIAIRIMSNKTPRIALFSVVSKVHVEVST